MDTVAVTGVVCPCPGTPHPDGDTVELRARLGLAAGIELQQLIVKANASGQTPEAMTGLLVESYIRLGVADWTFVGEGGGAVPVNAEMIQKYILDDFTTATPVAEKANDLYEGPVLGPLVNGVANSSRSTRTGSSTSRTGSGSQKNPKRSQQSSTGTTQTAVTATT